MDKQLLKKFISKKENIVLGVGILVVVLLGVVLIIQQSLGSSSGLKLINKNVPTSTPQFIYFSKLNGAGVKTFEEQTPDVVGIMIDNSPDVTSQAGLSQASVVYEAFAEGGITRYFALFSKDQPLDAVGPVRSARMYFLDWIQEYGDAMYVHVGGSPEALSFLRTSQVFDINEFSWGKYFWRDTSRPAPHNVFTKTEHWQAIFDKVGSSRQKKNWEGWKFSDTALTQTASGTLQSAVAVTIPYTSNYKVSWVLSPTTTRYERSIDQVPDKDSLGVRVQADNVLVQYTATKVVDEVGRRDVETVGSGEAYILRRGKMVHGSWKKDSVTSRTRFFDGQGNEIVLVPGTTWIEVVPLGTVLDITS